MGFIRSAKWRRLTRPRLYEVIVRGTQEGCRECSSFLQFAVPFGMMTPCPLTFPPRPPLRRSDHGRVRSCKRTSRYAIHAIHMLVRLLALFRKSRSMPEEATECPRLQANVPVHPLSHDRVSRRGPEARLVVCTCASDTAGIAKIREPQTWRRRITPGPYRSAAASNPGTSAPSSKSNLTPRHACPRRRSRPQAR